MLKIHFALRDLDDPNDPIPLFKKVNAKLHEFQDTAIVQQFHIISKKINSIIDFDESQFESRFVVKQFVDPELDAMKKIYHGLESTLSQVACEIVNETNLRDLNVIYFPQLGYLITLPNNGQDHTAISPHLELQFLTETYCYYKNPKMCGISLLTKNLMLNWEMYILISLIVKFVICRICVNMC